MTETNRCNDSNCSDPNCCSTQPHHHSVWKTFVFIAVILCAGVVATYSMLARGNDSGCAAPCGNITTVGALQEKLSGYDFGFVVLLGSSQSLPEELSESIVAASIKIENMKLRTRTLILNTDSPGYDEAIEVFRVDSLPAVLALGKTNSAIVPRGAFTESDLMHAYAMASTASCCPSTGSK